MRTKKKKENEKKDKKDKVFAIKTPGQPSIKDVDDWTQGPDNADQIHTMRTFNLKTPGQDRDYSKLVTTRKFQKFESNDKTRQDPDVKDKKGTQPAKYYSGLAKSTKSARDAHFKKKTKVDDDNPAAYTPAPGDSKGKTKPSVHTKKFKQMYGEEPEYINANDVKEWALETTTINKFKDRYQTEWRIELDKAVAEMLEQVKMEESKEAGLKKKAEKSIVTDKKVETPKEATA